MSYLNKTKSKLLRGGKAIPIDSNMYYIKGNTHEQGGVDINPNLEVEDGELVQVTPKNYRVFSAQPILNGISPAQAVLGGLNPNVAFRAQERFKIVNGYNDDGSRKARLGLDTERYKTDINYRKQIIAEAQSSQKNNSTIKSGNYNSPIFADNQTQIAASEQGKMDRVNKQIADKERIDNGIKEGVKTIAENTPIIGDIITGIDITKDLKDKQYLSAGIGAASLLLPFGIGKAIKSIRNIRNTKRLIKKYDNAINATYNDKNIRYVNPKDYHPLRRDIDNSNIIDTKINNSKIKNQLLQERPNLKNEFGNDLDIDDISKNVMQNDDNIHFGKLNNDVGGQYNSATNGITINEKLKGYDNTSTMNHERGHALRTYLKRYVDEDIYDDRYNNYIKLKQTSSNPDRVVSDVKKFTSNEATILDDAFEFTDDFIKNNDVSVLDEKAQTVRNINYEIFKRYIGSYDKLNIESLNQAIDDINYDELIDIINNSNGYGQDFVTKMFSDINKDFDGPMEELVKTKEYKDYIKTKIPKIKNALKTIGVSTGVIATSNNQTKDKKAMGGIKPRVPFTGGRTGTKKKAELGISESQHRWNRAANPHYTRVPFTPQYNLQFEENAGNNFFNRGADGREHITIPTPTLGFNNYSDRYYDLPEVEFVVDKSINNTPTEVISTTPTASNSTVTPTVTSTVTKPTNSVKRTTKRVNTPTVSTTTVNDTVTTPTVTEDISYTVPTTNPEGRNTMSRTRISTNTTPVGYETADFDAAYDVNPNKSPYQMSLLDRKINTSTIDDKPLVAKTSETKSKSNGFKGIFGDFTKSDLIRSGLDIAGSIASTLINKNAINNMQAPKAPAPKFAKKMKTRIDINAPFDRMRETTKAYEDYINRNTLSNAVSRNAVGKFKMNSILQGNQLYTDKENKETELINQDRLNRQEVANANIDAYNQYQDRLTEFNNKITDLKSENLNGLISGINSSVQNTLTNREKRNSDYRTILAMAAANPNLDIEKLASIFGKDFGDKLKRDYRKLNPIKS